MKDKNTSQKGSALFLVLIAVGLFAALSYAVAQMMSGSGSKSVQDLSEQQARLYASEILDYGRVMRQTVQNLRISNGCSDTDISFENPVVSGFEHTAPVARDECKVFDSAGGGLSWLTFNQDVYDLSNPLHSGTPGDIVINGENVIDDVGTSGNTELILFIPAIKESVCFQANNLLGLGNTDFDSPGFSVGSVKFTGPYSTLLSQRVCPGTLLDGKMQGCCHETAGCGGGDCYHYYQVLIAR